MVARPQYPVDKVRELQRRLYLAAQRNRERRFHALYDRIWRSDVLLEAWKRVRSWTLVRTAFTARWPFRWSDWPHRRFVTDHGRYQLPGTIRYPGGAHAA